MKLLSCLLLVGLTATAFAYFEHRADAPSVMNGINLNDYADFTKKWKLVTVRYREDSNELRFTYANAKAMKALNDLKPNYPDGAMFGKVSFYSEMDPAFPSSKVPSGTRRFQLMLKDKKKYKETDGWGYALYDSDGKLFNEDVKEKTMACATCHRIVPERDYVFSRPLVADIKNPNKAVHSKGNATIVTFKARKKADFKGAVLEHLDATAEIESLEGPLQKHAFSGTLDEVIPLLLERVRLTKKDSLLFVNEANFSLVKVSKDKCDQDKGTKSAILIYFNNGKVRDAEYCLIP